MSKPVRRSNLLREVAQRRQRQAENPNPEEWARLVEEARLRGCTLVRVPGMTIEIRDYSLKPYEPD